jgi:hypothetical protein
MEIERSSEKITSEDLRRFAGFANADRDSFFKRHPNRIDTFRCAALCQGGALHYLDGRNGLKDIDLWSFYERREGVQDFPVRRRMTADFGDSKFGFHPDDRRDGFRGRRIDLLGRSIEFRPDEDVVSALRRYLAQGQTSTARALAEKAVILIEPEEYLGLMVWPRA